MGRVSCTVRPVGFGPTRFGRRFVAFCWLLATVGACSSEDEQKQPPASQPTTLTAASQPAEPPQPEPEPSVLLPESETWSQAEALAKLADEGARLSAAVRLIRLAGAAPLCVPDPLPAKIARRLRVTSLTDSLWALGWEVAGNERLQSPVLVNAAGEVTLPVDGVEEETALLCCAEDAELFPHLLITPRRVLIIGDDLQSALVTKSPPGLSFDLRSAEGRPYVALLWRRSAAAGALHAEAAPAETELTPPDTEAAEANGEAVAEGDTAAAVADEESQQEGEIIAQQGGPAADRDEAVIGEPVEVAQYKWDAWELAFVGPLSDKLPDPPGGLFELDLEQSAALTPVGGVIPEPPPLEPPPDDVEPEPPPY